MTAVTIACQQPDPFLSYLGEPAPETPPATPDPSTGGIVTPVPDPVAGEDSLSLDAFPIPQGVV